MFTNEFIHELMCMNELIHEQVVARAYCDGVIKLSDSLQSFPRSAVCNVHGVRSEFIEAGRAAATAGHHFGEGAYFIGKVLWLAIRTHTYL